MKNAFIDIFVGCLFWLALSSPAFGQACASGNAQCIQATSHSTSGSTTNAVTFTNNVVNGNTVTVAVIWASTTVTITGTALSTGCAATAGFLHPTPSHGANPSVNTQTEEQGYAVLTTGGACKVTVTFSSAVNSKVLVKEIHVGAFDCSSVQYQSNTAGSASSLACTTTVNGEYLHGVGFDEGGNAPTWTAGTNFTLDNVLSAHQAESSTQTTAGSVAATFTLTPAYASSTTMLMAFKPVSKKIHHSGQVY